MAFSISPMGRSALDRYLPAGSCGDPPIRSIGARWEHARPDRHSLGRYARSLASHGCGVVGLQRGRGGGSLAQATVGRRQIRGGHCSAADRAVHSVPSTLHACARRCGDTDRAGRYASAASRHTGRLAGGKGIATLRDLQANKRLHLTTLARLPQIVPVVQRRR